MASEHTLGIAFLREQANSIVEDPVLRILPAVTVEQLSADAKSRLPQFPYPEKIIYVAGTLAVGHHGLADRTGFHTMLLKPDDNTRGLIRAGRLQLCNFTKEDVKLPRNLTYADGRDADGLDLGLIRPSSLTSFESYRTGRYQIRIPLAQPFAIPIVPDPQIYKIP